MNIFGYLVIIAGGLFFISFVICLLCYFAVTPIILKKRGIRNFTDSYLWIVNCCYAEEDLNKLVEKEGDMLARKTALIIKISKITMIVGFFFLIIFSFLS